MPVTSDVTDMELIDMYNIMILITGIKSSKAKRNEEKRLREKKTVKMGLGVGGGRGLQ